jgi:formate hydrogenlyase subunit 4
VNGVLAVILAVLIYPGVLVAVIAALLLSWSRTSVRSAFIGSPIADPLREAREVRATLERDAVLPEGAYAGVIGLASCAAIILPLVALVLLPVPGNPLVDALGLRGDLAAEGGLLLGVPLLLLFVGWAIPSPYTRLAADRSVRLLAGALLPMVLGLAAIAEQLTTLQLRVLPDPRNPLVAITLITRLLAALAFACTLPVLARTATLRAGGPEPELLAGELSEVSGRDLARFRIAAAIQLVAVSTFFVAAFLLPLFPTVEGGGRTAVWVAGIIATAVGIGVWEGFAARAPVSQERPPLSWWLGLPVLVGLLALVAAAWAARGA